MMMMSVIEIDIDAEDPPDVLESDQVDLGAYVIEHVSLDIDPYPRKPGAEFAPPEDEAAKVTPFDALAPLSDRLAGRAGF